MITTRTEISICCDERKTYQRESGATVRGLVVNRLQRNPLSGATVSVSPRRLVGGGCHHTAALARKSLWLPPTSTFSRRRGVCVQRDRGNATVQASAGGHTLRAHS